jgi:hypothetical protein
MPVETRNHDAMVKGLADLDKIEYLRSVLCDCSSDRRHLRLVVTKLRVALYFCIMHHGELETIGNVADALESSKEIHNETLRSL